MSIKTLTRSFAGGVITPEMFGRLDLAKYQTGLAEAINFQILPHGPAANRTGDEYVLEVKDSSKLTVIIPFIYSTTQTYQIELGDAYVRFHTAGGTVLEAGKVITAITKANPGVVTSNAHGFSNGDWVYLSGIVGMTQLNGRFAVVAGVTANTFDLHDTAGNNINTTNYTTYSSAGTAARVYEIASPYATAHLLALHYTQSADVLTITHPSYAPRELRRSGATSWAFTLPPFVPTIIAPTSPTVAASPASGTPRHRYKVTSVATDGLEESLGSQPAVVSSTNITGITQANPGVITAVAHGRAVGDHVYISGIVGMTQLNGIEFLVNTVPTVDTLTLKTLDGTVINTTAYTAWSSGGTVVFTDIANDLAVAGNKNTVTWVAATGAIRYNVYKNKSGLYGYIGQTSANTFVDDNISPDETKTPPEIDDAFTGADNYPGAIGYFQGRRWFAGSNNKKQNVWATRSGTESNMSYSIPTQDSDRIAFRIAARQANTIRHIVPLDDLLLLTTGGAWKIIAQNSDAITPSSVDPRPQSAIGASDVQPIVTNEAVLYGQDQGGRIRELKLSESVNNKYNAVDISIMAPHLFNNFTITSMAWTQGPYPMGWFVRSDGKLLGLTYVPEHQVAAWHLHETDGLYESVCVVPEGNEDVLYSVVKRNLNNRTVRCIERRHSRLFTELEDCFFVDCGLTYDSTPATTITGLWHLEGETVAILADGAVLPQQVVTSGTVTLDQAASVVHVGLPFTAKLQTLPISLETQALGQGTQKNVNKAYLRVHDSSSIMAGPAYDKLKTVKQRTTEPYGSPPELISDEKGLVLTPSWNSSGQVCVQQSDPLPLTLLSLTLDVAIGG